MGTEMVHSPAEDLSASLMESVLLSGDLAKLRSQDRVEFYNAVCKSLGLNPLTKPFEYINLNGKLRLYATKDCAEQLRKRDGISIRIVGRDLAEDVYIVTARATDKEGREDESVGAVPLGALKGEARANAIMKAETKAKRRVTLSICGLGMLDTSEADSIPTATRIVVDDAGEIKGELPPASTETREEVRDRKLADVKKSPRPKHEPDPSKGWFPVMLDGFSAMKEAIGQDAYYRVLGNNGYEHANQIPDRETGMRLYREMVAFKQAVEEPEQATEFVGEPA